MGDGYKNGWAEFGNGVWNPDPWGTWTAATGKIGHWDILNHSPENYFLDCSKLPREKEIQLTLENNEVSRPCDLIKGSTDDRTLGIGLFSLSIEQQRK